MGLLSGLLGNASELKTEKIKDEYDEFLVQGEEVVQAFKVIRDLFLFTNKRLILVDKKGATGKKTEYLSIPYRSIYRFSIETAGHFDLDSELRIWIGSNETPLTYPIKRGTDIIGIQKTLATYTM